MAFIGRLHPLLIHFPIALVIAAAGAEGAATLTHNTAWRSAAVHNIRAGAVCAVLAAIAGWRLALAPEIEASALLEWHQWVGSMAAAATLAAALLSAGAGGTSAIRVSSYRIALFTAGALVAVTGHLGGVLVWGANFLRP